MLLVSIVMPGCVNENRERHDPVVKLRFEPVMHAQVRSEAAAGDPSEHDDPQSAVDEPSFGVSAWTLDETATWDSAAASAEEFLVQKRLLRNGLFWYSESAVEWPSNRYNLTCIGFAPFEAATECSRDRGVVFEQVDTSTDPGDLRYSEPQTELAKSRNGGIITLPMLPALCQLGFRVRGVSGYDDTRVYVRRIMLEGLGLRGSFCSLPAPVWELSDQRSAMTFFEGDLQVGYTPQEAGTPRRIIPQKLSGTITVEYEFETPAGNRLQQTEIRLPVQRTLDAGRQHTLTLAVSPAGVEVIPENPTLLD